MAAGRDDDTPPGMPSARPGRYHERSAPVDHVTPLPPPPVQYRPPTGPVFPREAVPQPVEQDITGRIQLALAGAPPRHVDRSEMRWLLGLAGTALLAGIVWWADVREGMRSRPTKEEVNQMLQPLRDDVRSIERLLDQRLPPVRP